MPARPFPNTQSCEELPVAAMRIHSTFSKYLLSIYSVCPRQWCWRYSSFKTKSLSPQALSRYIQLTDKTILNMSQCQKTLQRALQVESSGVHTLRCLACSVWIENALGSHLCPSSWALSPPLKGGSRLYISMSITQGVDRGMGASAPCDRYSGKASPRKFKQHTWVK